MAIRLNSSKGSSSGSSSGGSARYSAGSVAGRIAAAKRSYSERQSSRSSGSGSSGGSSEVASQRYQEVGSGSRGGVLVRDSVTGEVTERFSTPAPPPVAPPPPASMINRGGGGSRSGRDFTPADANYRDRSGVPGVAPAPSQPPSQSRSVSSVVRSSVSDRARSAVNLATGGRNLVRGLEDAARQNELGSAQFSRVDPGRSEARIAYEAYVRAGGTRSFDSFVSRRPNERAEALESAAVVVVPGGAGVRGGRVAQRVSRAVPSVSQRAVAAARARAALEATRRAREAARAYLSTRPAQRLAKDVVVSGAQAFGVAKGAEAVSKATRPDLAVSDEDFERVYRESLRENLKPTGEKGVKAFIRDIGTGLTLFAGNKESFAREARSRFSAAGLSGKELDDAVSEALRTRGIRGKAEIANLLNIARAGERIGTREVGVNFLKNQRVRTANAFRAIFGRAARGTGKAGVAEGAAVSVALNMRYGEAGLAEPLIERQDIAGRSVPLPNPNQPLVGAAVGGASAGLLGGAIAAGRATRRVWGRPLEWFANILDPYEKPGDVAEAARRSAAARISGVPARVPVVSVGGDVVNFDVRPVSPTPSQTPSQSRSKVSSRSQSPSQSRSRVPSQSQSRTQTRSRSSVPVVTPTFTPGGSPTPSVPTPVSPPSVPTPVSPPTIVDEGGDTPVPTQTPTPVFTFAPVPVVTPFPRVPPMLPLPIPAGGSGRGGSSSGKRRYIDELQASAGLLRALGMAPVRPSPKKVEEREKARAKALEAIYGKSAPFKVKASKNVSLKGSGVWFRK